MRPGSRARPCVRTRARRAAHRRRALRAGWDACVLWLGSTASHRRTRQSRQARAADLPPALVQIQHPTGLLSELRVAREDPRTVAPRSDRILTEPPPDRDRCDLSDDSALDRLPCQLSA